MRSADRRRLRLHRDVRELKKRVAALEAPPSWTGPRLTAINVTEAYEDLRRQHVRAIVMKVGERAAEVAIELIEMNEWRALAGIRYDPELPPDGWRLEAAEMLPARTPPPRRQ
jgi:hypothetical protein